MKRRVTQADIAKALGITQVAVSKALIDAPDISTEVKEKVLNLCRELGYRKDRIASSLVDGKTRIIGYLVPKSAGSFFIDLLTSIERKLHDYGYQVLIKTWNRVSDLDDNDIELFLDYNVDGIISFPKAALPFEKSIYQKLLADHIPVVFINQDVPLENAVCVFSDGTNGVYEAVTHLIENGHKHIGLVTCNFPFDTSVQRRNLGYTQALHDKHIALNDALILKLDPGSKIDSVDRICSFLNSHPEITAIAAYSDILAMNVYDAAEILGLNIPNKLSVTGFGNDLPFSKYFKIPLTTVSQFGDKIGAKAVELLLDLINGNKVEQRNVMPAHLLKAQSVLKINGLNPENNDLYYTITDSRVLPAKNK